MTQTEKSCGAVVFRRRRGKIEFLLIKSARADHRWGFPKGHVEPGENEEETAAREIAEETGLSPRLVPGFRESIHYAPRPGVDKEAVYFLAEWSGGAVRTQPSEIESFVWLRFGEARESLEHETLRIVLENAAKFLLDFGNSA